jgi:tetratricopeptide (TPR) repeat protein
VRFLTIIFLLLTAICAQAQITSAKWKAVETEADTLLNRQDYQGALKKYNEAIEISQLKDNESKRILYKRAICFYSLQEFQKALNDLNVFIPQYPAFPNAKYLRAFVNRELGNKKAQLDDINDLLIFSPSNPDLLKFKANIYLESESYDTAKMELQNLQKIVNDEMIEAQLGLAYYNLSDPDSAFVHFDAALNINGGYAPAYMYITSICLEQEAYTMALDYVDLGLRLEPDNQQLIFYKGIALAETGKLEEGCRLMAKVFYAGLDHAGDYLKQYCYSGKD